MRLADLRDVVVDLHHARIAGLSEQPVGGAEIVRTDDEEVDAFDLGDLVQLIDRVAVLDLQDLEDGPPLE